MYDEQALAMRHEVPLKVHVLIYAVQVAVEGLMISSVHALSLHEAPPEAWPQEFPLPSLIALQRAEVFKV